MKKTNPVMACITAQESCERIIVKAKELANHLNTALEVVSVQPKRMEATKRAREMKCLEYLSKKTDCAITVIYSEHPLDSLATHAASMDPVHIFTGQQSNESAFVGKLSVLCDTPISMITSETVFTIPPRSSVATLRIV
ncbi:MAG: hypothetical protein PHV07_07405 [Oscillospiraceae bacterium]|nr:hypothetical protein [Oscillospiraceae bacterium]